MYDNRWIMCRLVFHLLCSEKTNKAMGCLDSSGGRELFCCSTAIWQGKLLVTFLLIFIWKEYAFPPTYIFWQHNFFSAEFWENYIPCPEQKQGSGGFHDILVDFLLPFVSLIFSNISRRFDLSGIQVRHYYYRLVRRMNKLLGPELCLDAKNSKDTNAAMLRW